MSKIAISGAATGTATFTIESPATSTNRTLTLPDNTGTIITQNSTPAFASTIGVGGATAAASGAGITFPATQSASSNANTLDDYEEGSWTPVIGGTGGQSGQSYSTQTGVYRKIGGLVYLCFDVTLSTKGTITNIVEISGFPFSVNGTANHGNAGGSLMYWSGLATSWNMIGGHSSDGGTSMILYGTQGSGNTTTTSLVTGDINNTTRLMGMAVYPSA